MVELIDLPAGQPGRPFRPMTQEQAAKVLKTADGREPRYIKVVKASKGRYGATHAATETDELACGTKTPDNEDDNFRLEALFVLSITLGLPPGELGKLAWDHVDLAGGVVHVWRSASKTANATKPGTPAT